ncbi:MAG: NTP transferase domain-containing protein [Bdellovibrionota bacterium]
MKSPLRVAILGAGLGSRLQGLAKAKPLAKISGKSLISRLQTQFRDVGAEDLTFALRDELLTKEDKASLPPPAKYLFVNTDSSLHTLVALIENLVTGPVLFSMVDTILRDQDLQAFWNFCANLRPEDCALLVTPFVDDEKPLWVQTDEQGYVKNFAADGARLVTSGMYFLTPEAMKMATELTAQGVHKMRNFLAALAEHGIPIKTFVVDKTIDVDHPSDLESAEVFLRGTKGSSP